MIQFDGKPIQSAESESLRCPTREIAREELSQLLARYGYDSSNPYQLKLARPIEGLDRARCSELIALNLAQHDVQFEKRHLAGDYTKSNPAKYEVFVIDPISSVSGSAISALNDFAYRLASISPHCELFIDPSGDLNTISIASFGGYAICAPLSAALDPNLFSHPIDPSLEHEMLHLVIESEFASGDPAFLTTSIFDAKGVSLEGDTSMLGSEYPCHALNFKKGLDNLFGPEAPSQSLDKVALFVSATAQEVLYLYAGAQARISVAENLIAALRSGEISPFLEPKPEGEGCLLHLFLNKSGSGVDQQQGMSIKSRAETFEEAQVSLEQHLTAELMYSRFILEELTPFVDRFYENHLMAFYGLGAVVAQEQRDAILACRDIIEECRPVMQQFTAHGLEHHLFWVSRECEETRGIGAQVNFTVYEPS